MTLTEQRRAAAADAEGLLVLLHGRGADEQDLFPLFDVFDPERRLLAVSPRGPLSLPPSGAHWYAVHEIGSPDPGTFLPTYALAGAWLDGLWEETGVGPERTVIGGFSQGAVMTWALGLGEGRRRPAALIALSGFMPSVMGWKLDLSPPLPPAAIGHGTYDPVISVDWSRQARDRLEAAGGSVVYNESPLAHTIDPRFAHELSGFVRDVLP